MISSFRKKGFGLVLSRKEGEAIIINNDVRVTVIEVRGNKVRLGVDAPKELPVHREEIWLEINGLTNDEDVS